MSWDASGIGHENGPDARDGGRCFLPPEAAAALKTLQSDSPPLEWSKIEAQLRKQIAPERLAELEIDPESFAAASLGQVHLARRKSDGARIALKIQYPGVDGAIDGDLKTLRSLLAVFKIFPSRWATYDPMFEEVRAMLHQEVDYVRELKNTEEFSALLKGDDRYVVPKVYPEYSSRRVLATEFQDGVRLDGPEVKALSQERRDRIAELILELYMREVFEFRQVQTDPHFGNYRVRFAPDGRNDQLVLLDFGAVRKLRRLLLLITPTSRSRSSNGTSWSRARPRSGWGTSGFDSATSSENSSR